MKILPLLILAALCSFSSAQVRKDPPVEISLRNVKPGDPVFKTAYEKVLQKVQSDFANANGIDAAGAEMKKSASKENPDGILLTEKQWVARLKKGEKFPIDKITRDAPCVACSPAKSSGTAAAPCKVCKDTHKVYAVQVVTYLW